MHFILNELVMGGMVLETNMTEILLRIEEQNKIAKEEVLLYYDIINYIYAQSLKLELLPIMLINTNEN